MNWWDNDPVAGSSDGPASPRVSARDANAISSIESSGNYRSIGPDTGKMGRALGKYQVMSENVGPWSREVLGREVTPQEFIANPGLQDAIFQGKFGQYVDKYGPEGAAKAWFAGEHGMNNPNAKDAFGTTVSEYARRFNKARGQDGPQDAVAAVNRFAPPPTQALAFGEDDAAAAPAARPVAPVAASGNWWDKDPVAPAKQPEANGRLHIYPNNVNPAIGPPAPAQPDHGVIDATARGAAQGITANFSDELRGLVEAGGANPNDPASLNKLILGALRYWSGDKDAKAKYEQATARERALNTTAEEQHPIASTVGQIGGAMVLPVGAGAQAATLPGRMMTGAAVGGVMGGAAGAGEGQGLADSVVKAGTGVVTGAALGGAAPALIEGAIRGGRAIAKPVVNTLRGVRNVDDEASRRIAVALERDMQADPQAASRLTAGEFAASSQNGGPAAIIDVGGDTTRALARSAANTSPEGRMALEKTINDRFEGQSDRVTGWLRNTFNYPDADAQQQALKEVARSVNKPAYAHAYEQGDKQVWSPELERLTAAPMVQSALNSAMTKWKNYAVRDGYGAMNPPFRIENGNIVRQGGSMPVYPNIQMWDYAARELQDAAREAKPGTQAASLYNDLARSMKTELDKIVPAYKAAREGAAGFFKADNALEAGQNFVNQNFAASEVRRNIEKMSPQERQLFQDGFVSRFVDTLDKVGDRRSILNKIAESPAAREKLNIALGRQRASELEAGLRVEGIMDLARTAVQGNSTTARQLAELGLAGGAYGFSGGASNPLDPSAMMNAALVYGAARGKNKINERLSRRVAEMLASNDPQTLLRGIQTVTRNREMFNSLRAADRGLSRVGGSNAPTMPALQAGAVSRADEQQPVPGTPSQ